MSETKTLAERLRNSEPDPYFADTPGVLDWLANNWALRLEVADALDAKDALLREARDALKLAQTIIGHPDDAGSQHIASVISKLEAQK